MVAEGIFELVPIRLLAPGSVIRQLSGVHERRDHGVSAEPLVLVASDMLDGTFADATNREIALVRAVFPDAQLQIGTQTGILGLLGLLARAPRHIHIVAHGTAVLDPRVADLDVYLGAGVAFASEMLTASHVADLHLEGVELVILSSCDTASGAAQHAEGMASMAAAFLDAGAVAVIATLWPVPHEETADFMGFLYAQDLADPAAALGKAQQLAQGSGMGKACWAAWVTHQAGPG
jgi:CHAT domain-containing protein